MIRIKIIVDYKLITLTLTGYGLVNWNWVQYVRLREREPSTLMTW